MPGSRPIIEREPAPVSLGPCPRILAIKLATLGDLLLALPSFRALRTRYPAARLDLLTTTASAPLIADSPLVDRVYTLDLDVARGVPLLGSLTYSATTLAQLRRNRYDAALLLHHLTLPAGRRKHRALLAVIAPRITAGLDNGHGGFLNLRVPDGGFGAYHEAEYALAVADAVGAAPLAPHERVPRLADLGWGELVSSAPAPRLHGSEGRAERFTTEATEGTEEREGSSAPNLEAVRAEPLQGGGEGGQATPSKADPNHVSGTPLVALHPGGGAYSLARRWPSARYTGLAAALHAEAGARIVVIAGSGEEELAGEVVAALGTPDWARVATPVTPRELAALLVRCALFVGNDAFPMHLAAAAGIPVVAIFGPSNAHAWGPCAPGEPDRVAIVRRDELPCSPCFYRGHDLGLREGCPPRMCLTNLPVERVLAAARRLLRAQTRRDATHGFSAVQCVPYDPAGA